MDMIEIHFFNGGIRFTVKSAVGTECLSGIDADRSRMTLASGESRQASFCPAAENLPSPRVVVQRYPTFSFWNVQAVSMHRASHHLFGRSLTVTVGTATTTPFPFRADLRSPAMPGLEPQTVTPTRLEDTDPRRQLRSQLMLRHSVVVLGLQVQPEAGLHAKKQPQTKRGVRRDGALAIHQFADPAWRDIHVGSELTGTDAHGLHEILQQDLARMDFLEQLGHVAFLVVVHDLDVVRSVRLPDEADPPLVVDADAMLPLRSAFSASNRFPSGIRKLATSVAAWS
jgi:hypothetical protein